ncbi:hypothetical protein CRUP_025441, partial [Coryphaenoides rupestris]
PVHNMGSSGYGSHGSNGSHEQPVSVGSSSESTGTGGGGCTVGTDVEEETERAKPRSFQEICKGVHMLKNQDLQVYLQSPAPSLSKPDQKQKASDALSLGALRSPLVRLKDLAPPLLARDGTAASMEDLTCKDQTVYSYQQISCLDNPMMLNAHPGLPSIKKPLAPLTLPRKAESVVSITSQCSYSSTIVHVGDKKPRPESGESFEVLGLQVESPEKGAQSDGNLSSSDLLDILLQEDSHSGTGSATSGSMGSGSGSGSNGCRTSASGASGSGTGSRNTSHYFGSHDPKQAKAKRGSKARAGEGGSEVAASWSPRATAENFIKYVLQEPLWLLMANTDDKVMMTYQMPSRWWQELVEEHPWMRRGGLPSAINVKIIEDVVESPAPPPVSVVSPPSQQKEAYKRLGLTKQLGASRPEPTTKRGGRNRKSKKPRMKRPDSSDSAVSNRKPRPPLQGLNQTSWSPSETSQSAFNSSYPAMVPGFPLSVYPAAPAQSACPDLPGAPPSSAFGEVQSSQAPPTATPYAAPLVAPVVALVLPNYLFPQMGQLGHIGQMGQMGQLGQMAAAPRPAFFPEQTQLQPAYATQPAYPIQPQAPYTTLAPPPFAPQPAFTAQPAFQPSAAAYAPVPPPFPTQPAYSAQQHFSLAPQGPFPVQDQFVTQAPYPAPPFAYAMPVEPPKVPAGVLDPRDGAGGGPTSRSSTPASAGRDPAASSPPLFESRCSSPLQLNLLSMEETQRSAELLAGPGVSMSGEMGVATADNLQQPNWP